MSLPFTLCIFCALLQWGTVSLDVPMYTLEKRNSLQQRNSEIQIHSRKRRYLIFPQGSSFQVVWDGIIGIVDYTNYLILGITVALAWELPSQPPSEILAEIKENLFKNDVKNMEVNTSPPIYVEHTSSFNHSDNISQPNAQRRLYLNSFQKTPYTKNWNMMYKKPMVLSKKRFEYLKRSLNTVHQNYHRKSRFELYGKIEKYLEKRDIHGHHCVLRALCERNQKETEQQQRSFMTALMQTIFQLPKSVADEVHDYRHHRYDKAHGFKGKCEARYRYCNFSLWSSPYLQ